MSINISVLGLGNWGTALAQHLAKKGHNVLGWSIEEAVVASINSEHRNSIYMPQINLSTNIRATKDFDEAISNPIIVLAFASCALKEVIPKLNVQERTLLISAIKGLESQSLMTTLEYAKASLSAKVRLAAISGPSFAKDVVRGCPCGVVAASENIETARETAFIFSSDSMRVYMSSDPIGVEIGGVVKNVIAIAAGICDGMNLGDSARSVLITRGLAEMMRLSKALGADVQTLSGLSGLGDLIMTASCDASRNRTVGLRLGRGETLDHILQTLGSVAEGVFSTQSVLALAKKHNVEVPISFQVGRILREEVRPEEVVQSFFARPLRKEFE